jgi:hypothetical protein
MLPTAEVRWFAPGPIPPIVAAWFAHPPQRAELEPEREDTYLLHSDGDGLGVKLREGRFEVKKRLGKALMTRWSPTAAGSLEHWRKWSFPIAGAERKIPSFGEASDWLTVTKRRMVRNYAVRNADHIDALPASAIPRLGCSIELTMVVAHQEVWWTFAFEAIGREDGLVEALTVVARDFLADAPPGHFAPDCSYGYARWLAVLDRRAAPR